MAKPTRFTPEMIEQYMKAGYWEAFTVADIWDRNALDHANQEAIVDSSERVTWAEAKQCSDRIALGLLELGLKRDDVVVLQLPPSVDHALMRLACEKAGLLCVPAMRGFRHLDMEYILSHVRAVAVVIRWEFAGFNYFDMIKEIRPNLPALKHILVVGDKVPEGTISVREMAQKEIENSYPSDYLQRTRFKATEFSLIAHTAGTTGFPKFLEHPICVNIALGKIWAEVMGVTEHDAIGAFSPVSRGPNVTSYYSAPLRAAKCVCLERFTADDALKLIEKERITSVGLTTSQIRLVMSHPDFGRYDLSSLKFINAGGEPVPYSVALEAEQKFKCCVLQIYGNTEVGGFGLASPDDPPEIRLTSFKARDGAKFKLVDHRGKEVPHGEVGELCVSGPTLSGGYFGDREATWRDFGRDGWFATGDLARIDDKGNIMIVGRKKEMIIRGGMNIYPLEIEKLLGTHPNVLDVAVVGMPDPVMGERACAFVALRPGRQLSFDEMVSFLGEKRVSSYQLPERLEIVNQIPKSSGEKVDKRVLREQITNKLIAEGKLKQ